MSDISCLLSQIESGDPQAAEQLLPLVYDELRTLAAARLAHEKPGQTLQATALVHEAYLRLVARQGDEEQRSGEREGTANDEGPTPVRWDGRGHFFSAAAEAMRRILVERARARRTLKRGGQGLRLDLEELSLALDQRSDELLALDEALCLLEKNDAQAAALVKLRFFAGLAHQDAAAALGISRRAADRLWAVAKAWLYQQVADS